MVTAAKKVDACSRHARRASSVSEDSPTELCVCAGIGGGFQWQIVDDNGEILMKSGRFASYQHADLAARIARAARARLQLRLAGDLPIDFERRGLGR